MLAAARGRHSRPYVGPERTILDRASLTDRRCTICDADDIPGGHLVVRGKRAGAAYCHACGRQLNGRVTPAVWIAGACAVLLAVAVLMIYGLR